ncbi:NAD-dependent epimerase/dehydratase family protein [Sporosarcina siberiensis]|uniref:NAD-dependent epimerase/dehydratase family protein n=1 Tax=Sporosarcina siberiensis TaxID=1365606 RepID=A0ABW4SFU9_9BACL
MLITGGAGFIGSHVIDELVKNDFQVVSVDNYITGFKSNLSDAVKAYTMDLNDPKLESVFINEQPDYVIHLAAQASVMASMNNPQFDFFTNTVGTVNVMVLSKKYHVKKFLFASTAAVYGEPEYLPIDEKHSINSQSFYALSKHSAENYIRHYSQFKGLDSCILRFSNVYGPRQNENGEAGVISIFINRLLGEEKVSIYDGGQTRDFVYVKDVAFACRLALGVKAKGIYNVSSCSETTIEELYYKISNLSGLHAMPIFEPKRFGEIEKSVLNNIRVKDELQWFTQYSLSEGLQETLQYYMQKKSNEKVSI